MAKHYVRFFYPGALFIEYENKEIQGRSIELNKVPKNVYGYFLYDIIEPKNKKPYVRKRSPMVYFGKPYTLEEIENLFPDLNILIHNIKNNGYKGAVKCRTGNWQPLNKGDIVIYEA